MAKRVTCKSGRKGWQDKLQNVYDSYDDFITNDRIYGISKRLGYDCPQDAWGANPTIQGSVNPSDLCVVKDTK